MDRRLFIKIFTATALCQTLPKELKLEAIKDTLNTGTLKSDFIITKDGNIKFNGDEDTKYTVLEFHRHLQDLANDMPTENSVIDIISSNPSIRYTDECIELMDSYKINGSTAVHLTDGTITQEDGKVVYGSKFVI